MQQLLSNESGEIQDFAVYQWNELIEEYLRSLIAKVDVDGNLQNTINEFAFANIRDMWGEILVELTKILVIVGDYFERNILRLSDVEYAWRILETRYESTSKTAGFDYYKYFDDEETSEEYTPDSDSEKSMLSDETSTSSGFEEYEHSIESEDSDDIAADLQYISYTDSEFKKLFIIVMNQQEQKFPFINICGLEALEALFEENFISSMLGNISCGFARAGYSFRAIITNALTVSKQPAITTPDFDSVTTDILHTEQNQSQQLIRTLQDLIQRNIYADQTLQSTNLYSSLASEEPTPAILKRTIALLTEELLKKELMCSLVLEDQEKLKLEVKHLRSGYESINQIIASTSINITSKSPAVEELPHEDTISKRTKLRDSLLRRPELLGTKATEKRQKTTNLNITPQNI